MRRCPDRPPRVGCTGAVATVRSGRRRRRGAPRTWRWRRDARRGRADGMRGRADVATSKGRRRCSSGARRTCERGASSPAGGRASSDGLISCGVVPVEREEPVDVVRTRRSWGGRSTRCRSGLGALLALDLGGSILGPESGSESHSLSLTPMPYYVTTPIYYVNSTAPYRARVHDDRCRHPRPALPATRRGHLFSDGGGRACVEGGPRRGGARARTQGVRRPHRRRLARGATADRGHRMTSSSARPTRGTRRSSRDFLQRIYDAGDIYEDVYAGLYCVGCEAFKTESELVDGKCPLHDTEPEWIEEKNWFFRLSTLPGATGRPLTTSVPDFVLPGFATTRREASSHSGLQDFSISRADGSRGASRSRGIREEAGRVRLGRCSRQLSERADLRPARRGSSRPILDRRSGTRTDREGHHRLPLRVLARDAALGGLRGAAPDLRARLPPARRLARSRSRSGTSSTRSISSTSTEPIPSGSGRREPSPSARTARFRSRVSTSATSASSPTIWAISSRVPPR